MTIGNAIKQYRADHGLSQAELADRLQVSPMTVSRLEADLPIRMYNDIAQTLVAMLGEEIINSIDENTKTLTLIQKQLADPEQIGKPSQKARLNGKTQYQAEEGCLNVIKKTFSDYKVNVFKTLTGDIYCKYNDKTWMFEIVVLECVAGYSLRDFLKHGIGTAALDPSINKYSLVWCSEDANDTEWIPAPQAFNRVNFDISFLHYNLTESRFDYELDIATNLSGTGFFDIAKPSKSKEAALMLAAWKTSITTLNQS